MNSDWMNVIQAAEYIGIAATTLNRWRQIGKGPKFYKVGDKLVRYKKSDLDAFMNGGEPHAA